uniref:Uncharacterized protein n=1 Tax=Ananas comosus var. bracteatus TaxID=296719 RepID=A0A6V7NHM7_ANACO|nr:unnamed protein product [Ananas comosus var. bracteatus]
MKKDSPEPRPPPHRSRSLGSAGAAAGAAVEDVGFPSRASTSAVPFSWEQRPGIPKPSGNLASPSPPSPRSDPLLPLPPPLRPAPSPPAGDDPPPPPPPPPPPIPIPSRRRSRSAPRIHRRGTRRRSGGCSVVESTVHVPRSGIRTGAYGLMNRR